MLDGGRYVSRAGDVRRRRTIEGKQATGPVENPREEVEQSGHV